MDYPPEHHLIVHLRKGPKSLFWFLVSEEKEAFIGAVIFFGQFDLDDVAEAGEGFLDFFLSELIGDVGYVETIRIDLQGLCHKLLVPLTDTRRFNELGLYLLRIQRSRLPLSIPIHNFLLILLILSLPLLTWPSCLFFLLLFLKMWIINGQN